MARAVLSPKLPRISSESPASKQCRDPQVTLAVAVWSAARDSGSGIKGPRASNMHKCNLGRQTPPRDLYRKHHQIHAGCPGRKYRCRHGSAESRFPGCAGQWWLVWDADFLGSRSETGRIALGNSSLAIQVAARVISGDKSVAMTDPAGSGWESS